MPAQCREPRLLLITGAPASGKTRLTHALGPHYGGGGCSKDEIKETLFETLGAGDAVWSRRLSDASFALLFRWATQLLGLQPLVLLEGNFRGGEHEAPLRLVLERSGATAAQVLCVAEPATRAARLAARAADGGRHPGHRDWSAEVSPGDGATFLDLPGPRLHFDSEADWDTEFAALCAELDRWHAPSKV
jgi:predicted kinase